jgi:hypothetical protein
MNRCLRILLAAIIALTSQQLALARGQSVAANEVALCLGGGLVTIAVDIDGNPVGPPHVCPDGVLSMAFALLHAGKAEFTATARPTVFLPIPATARLTQGWLEPQARAPPAPV